MNKTEADIEKMIKSIRDDLTNGCSTIVLNSIPIIKSIFQVFRDDNKREIYLSKLKSAKPAMPAIGNIIDYSIHEYNETIAVDLFFNELENKVNDAQQVVIENAKEYFKGQKEIKILTVSFSSMVVEVLNSMDSCVEVFAVESIWNSKSYGEQLQKSLDKSIKSFLIKDDEIEDLIEDVDYLLLGCDGFNELNDIINGIPSRRICEHFYEYAEIIVLAESYKKTKFLTVESGFDEISSKFIDKIITDNIF